MITIQLSNVTLVLGANTIFRDLSWSIQHDQKIGLIGPNGAGKSSLFKLITGEFTSESGGAITRARGVSVGYLAQQPELDPEQNVLSAALGGNPRWQQLHDRLIEIEHAFGEPRIYNDSRALGRLIEEQQQTLEAYEALGGDGYPGRVEQVLLGLGLVSQEFHKPIAALSGGQKKLVGLARLLLEQPSVLLLDEPDNHLDLAGKVFLERWIAAYPGAVILISHDRYLLDRAVTHITELEDGKLTTFQGDYTSYIIDKEVRMRRADELYKVQAREIARLEAAAKRYAIWAKQYDNGKFAARAKAIEGRIDRIDRLDRPVLDRKRMGLELTGWRGSKKVLEIKQLRKAYSDRSVLEGVDLLLRHGERVGLIGANGAGKSVLFRLVLGQEQPDQGEIITGPSVQTGYYAQEHESLDPEMSLIDTVRRGIRQGATMSEDAAVAFLGRFLFSYRMVRQPVKDLSGGERSRLQLALLVLSGANFLLLDEPTNNLDIASAEVLEAALEDFEGTVLVISHDRYFLDRTVDRLLVIDNGRGKEFLGGYSEWAEAEGGL
jgi:ATP-binding cassette, subfamily F, member 3